jgi:hypothetical protein
MSKSCFTIFILFILLSCAQNKNGGSVISVRKEAMDAAVRYARDKFKEAKETVGGDGVVTVADNQVNYISPVAYQLKYVIDPSKIMIGQINDDSIEDAIVYIAVINIQDLETPEHLILIKTEGKLVINRVIETNMRVLGIKNRIITAEVSTRSLNSPLRDCNVCKEVVKYQFKSGDLIRAE